MNQKYYLILEHRHGDYMPIDINMLTSSNYDYTSLQAIDRFTSMYSVNEILKKVMELNLLPDKYLFGNLKVINSNNYCYQVLTKNYKYSFIDFIKDNIDNKQIMNKLMNVYIKYNREKMIDLKNAIINHNIEQIVYYFSLLSYEEFRWIYIYIFENILEKEQRLILENSKAA